MSLVGYGWCWRPGRVWGPGWVSWRAGGGYVGWAPLPPRGVRIAPPAAVHGPWRFTTASEFGSQHPNYVAPRVAAAVYNHTATVANFQSAAHTARFNGGPTAALLGHSATQVGLSGLRNAAPHSAIVPRPTSPSLNRVGAPLHTPTTLATPRAPYAAPVRPQQPAYRSDLVGPVPPGYRAPSVVTRPSYAPGYGQRYGAPGYGAPSYAAPHYATQPSYAAPRYAPNYAPGYASPHYGAPSYHTAPSYNYGAPHYSAPSYSAPHYSAPSYSAPHYSAPSYSAPHYSAPSRPSYSAPAFHGGGGGGMHFGGGGGGHFGGGHR
jgi:hypothetical protein